MTDEVPGTSIGGVEPLPAERGVDLWAVHLTAATVTRSSLDVLPADERAQAARFTGTHRAVFVERRALLRGVLARYIGRSPHAVEVDRRCVHCGDAGHGRPEVAGPVDLSFSTSRCGDRAVIAVARRHMRVAVDLERVDGDAAAAIRQTALTPTERLAAHDAVQALRLWCRKEAVLKASGHGLVGRDVASFDALGDPVLGLHVHDLVLGHVLGPVFDDSYVGAIASTAPVSEVRVQRWPPG